MTPSFWRRPFLHGAVSLSVFIFVIFFLNTHIWPMRMTAVTGPLENFQQKNKYLGTFRSNFPLGFDVFFCFVLNFHTQPVVTGIRERQGGGGGPGGGVFEPSGSMESPSLL